MESFFTKTLNFNRENPKWRNYVKSKPKNVRDRLDRIAIKERARRYEKFEKDRNHENLVSLWHIGFFSARMNEVENAN